MDIPYYPEWQRLEMPRCTISISGASIAKPNAWVFIDNRGIEIPVTIIQLDKPKDKKK